MAMAPALCRWSRTRDDEGNREYTATWKVEGFVADGPERIANQAGLPVIGAPWTSAIAGGKPFNDSDPWAFCTPYEKVTPVIGDDGEGVQFWYVEKKFSTLPFERCQDVSIQNPLAEPMKINGSFVDGKKKITTDKDGNFIQTTSFDDVEIEVPDILPTVRIQQNVLNLQLSTFTPMITTLNQGNMWGLQSRRIRLAGASWERQFYGVCYKYYTRTFEFEVNFNGFDRDDIPNKSKSFIRGEWAADGSSYNVDGGADVNNPFDYIAATDYKGNPKEYFLNKTTGAPASGETFLDPVAYATESNFFALGIPTVL